MRLQLEGQFPIVLNHSIQGIIQDEIFDRVIFCIVLKGSFYTQPIQNSFGQGEGGGSKSQ